MNTDGNEERIIVEFPRHLAVPYRWSGNGGDLGQIPSIADQKFREWVGLYAQAGTTITLVERRHEGERAVHAWPPPVTKGPALCDTGPGGSIGFRRWAPPGDLQSATRP